MLNHVSIGVGDIARTKAIHDARLAPLGFACFSADDTALGNGAYAVRWWLGRSPNHVPADSRSVLHPCFAAPTRASLEAFHRFTPANDGSSDGAPGPRADYDAHYYAAFVIHPDRYRRMACYDKPS
jgi:hypothetical protein